MISEDSIIKQHIDKIISVAKSRSITLDENHAFDYFLVSLFKSFDMKITDENFYDSNFKDIEFCVTDGKDDGGIDFVIFDDSDTQKLIIGQSKNTNDLQPNKVVEELRKMKSTLNNFKSTSNLSIYNDNLKKALSEALDTFESESDINVEYYICTTANIDNTSAIENKILSDGQLDLTTDEVSVYAFNRLTEELEHHYESKSTVDEYKFEIDEANNYLQYNSEKYKGAFANISSKSLINLYNSKANDGLFDLNIRNYFKSKGVDSGIIQTLNKYRSDFWFLNNGLTIVCTDFSFSGNSLKVKNFSIVNGGQTTYLISTYKGNNHDEFFIPCKLVSNGEPIDDLSEVNARFFSQIAQATNTQKAISPRDLRSNSNEMISLQAHLLNKYRINLTIKKGTKKIDKNKFDIEIANDQFAQIMTSFVYQQPGKARSSKMSLFENDDNYKRVFRLKYLKDQNKSDFVADLIRFNSVYTKVLNSLKNNIKKPVEADVLRNGRYMLMGLFGLLYTIVNNDYAVDELYQESSEGYFASNFVWGSFFANEEYSEVEKKIERLTQLLLILAAEKYQSMFNEKEVTNTSNFTKKDTIYRDKIADKILYNLSFKTTIGEQILEYSSFLKRY